MDSRAKGAVRTTLGELHGRFKASSAVGRMEVVSTTFQGCPGSILAMSVCWG